MLLRTGVKIVHVLASEPSAVKRYTGTGRVALPSLRRPREKRAARCRYAAAHSMKVDVLLEASPVEDLWPLS